MAGQSARIPLVSRIPILAYAALVGAVFAGLAPLEPMDNLVREALLRVVAPSGPPKYSIVVTSSAQELRDETCGDRLVSLLRKGGAKGALLLEPVDQLCLAPQSPLPVHPLPRRLLRMGSAEQARGFQPLDHEQAPSIGLVAAPWVRARKVESVPAIAMSDLSAGHVDALVLRDRVVVLAFEEHQDGALAPSVAGIVDAALEGRGRGETPGWLNALLGALCGAGLGALHRRFGIAKTLLASGGSVLVTVAAQLGLVIFLGRSLLPLASLGLALLAALVTILIPSVRQMGSALKRATQLIDRAALFRVRGLDGLDNAEFFAKLANLAEQCHPANIVLIAELPAHKWHLRFWPNRKAGENLVGERRRDVRRVPYVDDTGLPTIRVVKNYLVMSDTPVVIVPLIALGEIEAYLFLCGEKAETAFLADPSCAERLAREFALILRRRRLSQAHERQWLSRLFDGQPGGSSRMADLARGAQVVLEDIEVFGTVMRDAPVGVLYADSFGHVRMIGRTLAEWLEVFGLPVPQAEGDPLLPPGSLTLGRVIGVLTGSPPEKAAAHLSHVMVEKDGKSFTVTAPADAGGQTLMLSIRAVRRTSDNVEFVAGYVATLVDQSQGEAVPANLVPLSRPPGDPLVAFPLAETVASAVEAAARAAGRPVNLEPARTKGQALACRAALNNALQAFLEEAASVNPKGQPPVVVVREKKQLMQIRILDLHPGVPASALHRTLEAPDIPPSGLEALGQLVRAVENSHGSVRVQPDAGWGVTLTIMLLRARSVVQPASRRLPNVVDMAAYARPKSTRPPPGRW